LKAVGPGTNAGQVPGVAQGSGPEEQDAATGFLSKATDWIDAFGRNFFPTNHTHLQNAEQREILPWLRSVPSGAKAGAVFDVVIILSLALPSLFSGNYTST
jgi:hypothetical protein